MARKTKTAPPVDQVTAILDKARELGRRCYMCELDPHYVDVIIQRWEKFTGQKAVKINV